MLKLMAVFSVLLYLCPPSVAGASKIASAKASSGSWYKDMPISHLAQAVGGVLQ
jgi:hypothetical protein